MKTVKSITGATIQILPSSSTRELKKQGYKLERGYNDRLVKSESDYWTRNNLQNVWVKKVLP